MPKRYFQSLLPAPKVLKNSLLKKIEREIQKHSSASPGLIQFKMNALEDFDITQALYRAAQVGVKIDLIIRDTCRLRPGIPGLSETVSVISVVGRFLEHSRIFYFQNAGEEEYFIGSADCMTRNLESRVEVVTPIENLEARAILRQIINTQLQNQRSVWEMHADGQYIQRRPTGELQEFGAQEQLIQLTHKRFKEAQSGKLKPAKVKRKQTHVKLGNAE